MRQALLNSKMAALALSLWAAGHSDAATIQRYSDPVMGCTMLLSGPIVEGDAERVAALVSALNEENPDRTPGRLCLNSPGGSYREGLRLAQTIQGTFELGTAIAEGHVCEGACAIAFMAGGWGEAGTPIRPIMHPRSRLGFHAPSLEMPGGQYSDLQVTQAWDMALQAIAEIVLMRSGSAELDITGGYQFHDHLLYQMLSTPPSSMYYIDTVEKAARYNIAVFPVGLNTSRAADAFRNLCSFAQGEGRTYSDAIPTIQAPTIDRVEAFFPDGFLGEGTFSCRVVLSLDQLRDRGLVVVYGWPPISIEFDGSESGSREFAIRRAAYPYMSFDPETRLDQLPTDIEGTWRDFISRVRASVTPATSSFGSCWLTSPTARIINVSAFVNLRRRPEFSATVIREVPLGEQVRVLTPNNNTLVSDRNNSCRNACQAFWRNANDRQARETVQQCINENIIWYEITDARGNRGWVSRRFLQEVR